MKQFMDADFLLSTDTAKWLYHEAAEPMPIIDYHCHIDPREIYENRKFDTITQVWLGGDHYKWRVMRAGGAPEEIFSTYHISRYVNTEAEAGKREYPLPVAVNVGWTNASRLWLVMRWSEMSSG